MLILGLLALCSPLQAEIKGGLVDRPNILWITSEDNGPHLGCYGDLDAVTPNLDSLAARSLRFDHAWSNAPVCAPARTTIITGMYAPSLGAHHMRSRTHMPQGYGMFPQLLRKAGYYCSNRSKTDYNVATQGQVWDQSGKNAHWRGRGEGQPFFSVFNFTSTHESQTRKRPHQAVHDPAEIHLPKYFPDLPEIRQDWAQYHDKISVMDAQVGSVLRQLEKDGLADETIVFYFADHGPGFARGKRWPGDSGMRVPFLVHVPPKFEHLAPAGYSPGSASSELVAFVDLAPTVLSIAGMKAPSHYQGLAFAGTEANRTNKYLFGFRGRMDERVDMSRSARDDRYVYIRNYYPRLPHGQHLNYMFQTPTTLAWKKAFDAGELDPVHAAFWLPRSPEELYDLKVDPDEVINLAASKSHQKVLTRMREANQQHLLKIKDLGFLPEAEMYAQAGEDAPRTLGLDSDRYPIEAIMASADSFFASSLATEKSEDVELNRSQDAALRFWFIQELMNDGKEFSKQHVKYLQSLLKDPSTSVRIAALEALLLHGPREVREGAIDQLVQYSDHRIHPFFACVQAMNVLDRVGGWTPQQISEFSELPVKFESVPRALSSYLPRLREHILAGHVAKD